MSKFPLREAMLAGTMHTVAEPNLPGLGDAKYEIHIKFETLEQMQDARRALYHAILPQNAAVQQSAARNDEPRTVTDDDREYASELLADLANDLQGLSRAEIVARWFRKARVEHSLRTPVVAPTTSPEPTSLQKTQTSNSPPGLPKDWTPDMAARASWVVFTLANTPPDEWERKAVIYEAMTAFRTPAAARNERGSEAR